MEVESRSMQMLLQGMSRRGFALTFVLFFTAFFTCIMIGAFGPSVHETVEMSAYNCPKAHSPWNPSRCSGINLAENGSHWIGEIRNLDLLNQELFLTATFDNLRPDESISKEIQMKVSIFGQDTQTEPWKVVLDEDTHTRKLACDQGSDSCDTILIAYQVFIEYNHYKFRVSFPDLQNSPSLGDVVFKFVFIQHKYTLFELWFRFIFLVFSFGSLVFFAFKMRHYKWNTWFIEQKWTVGLLFSLMAYNNPFYPTEILFEGWFPIFLNRLLYGTFLAVLLYFWLAMFDGIRKHESQRTLLKFYVPKMVLIGILYVCIITVFTWSQLEQKADPLYQTSSELPGYLFFQILVVIIMVSYLLWLLFCVFKAISDTKTLPYLGMRIKFFGIFTFLVILVVVGGIIFGAVGTSFNSPAEFLSYLAIFNLYCYTLAIVYLPVKGARMGPSGLQRLQDDSEEVIELNDSLSHFNVEPVRIALETSETENNQ